jgi:citrate lyase subunit beta/citryl-CoA lyase
LFVPGDRPERFEKARSSGADEVIIDLEDAVDAVRKGSARASAAEWLFQGSAWVRINAVDTAWYAADVAVLANVPGLRGIVLPKAENPAQVKRLAALLPAATPIVPLVETALGLYRVVELARCAATARLAFGSVDFSLDVGCGETDAALLFARSQIVLASRIAGLPAPVDGVTVDLADPGTTAAAAEYARELGFGGKLCIHPSQVGPVQVAFRPTPAELAWARQILEASSAGGAVRVEGRMVDRPVVERARRLLSGAAT